MKAKKAEPLALMTLKVVARLKLSAVAPAVVTVLLDHLNWKTGRCDPGLARIARLAGCTHSGARKAIAQLTRAKVLKVTTHGGGAHTTAYAFDWDLIRKLDAEAQEALGYAPHGAEGVPLTGHGGMPRTGHQTRRTNPMKEPLGVSYSPGTGSVEAQKGHAERSEPQQRPLPFKTAIPGGRLPSRTEAAEAASSRRRAREISELPKHLREAAWLAEMAEAATSPKAESEGIRNAGGAVPSRRESPPGPRRISGMIG